MGILNTVGTERQYERNGLPVKMNVIELEAEKYACLCFLLTYMNCYCIYFLIMVINFLFDTSSKIECALFGAYVDELNSFLSSGETQRPLVIIQLAKVKPFQGDDKII